MFKEQNDPDQRHKGECDYSVSSREKYMKTESWSRKYNNLKFTNSLNSALELGEEKNQ